ncbi:MAG: ribose 5-phosphate isomerase [Candidatus Parcubacteria bacterium]|jgi:ribose 5-phosphate isomerase B|nr:ribose 5-phosphate isomerase [Candidatus Parcubacteria bacterium]
MKQKIILATDHAGFKLKEAVKSFLAEKGYAVDDVGAHEYDKDDDYPVYMMKAGLCVSKDLSGSTKAVIFGGSGQGEAMVANRFPGVRAAVWYGGSEDVLIRSREHNDANVLSIGAWSVPEEEAKKGVELWLTTPFSEAERHKRRIKEIDSIE